MSWFTVVAFYEDNHQPLLEWIETKSASKAAYQTIDKYDGGVWIVEVFANKQCGVLGNEEIWIQNRRNL